MERAKGRIVLVELGLVEQRYRAVLEILDDGATVVEVARRYGVYRDGTRVASASKPRAN